MTDNYTKAVLTVIAIALLLLVGQNYTKPTKAAFGECAGSKLDPCRMIMCESLLSCP
jgi:hypothetical protein